MKNLLLTIALISLFFNLSIYAQTATAPSAGDGSLGNPYQITTWQNLYWLSQNSAEWNKYYIQTANIDFADASPAINTWDTNKGWTPIGNTTTKFIGTYNGNTKTISGLYVNRAANFQGFFGYTNGGSISNLGLLAVNINGSSDVGGLAGFTESTIISNCYSTGTVIGTQYIGGLIGNHYLGSVSSSFSSCNVTGTSACGGLVGIVSGNVQNCYSTGDVTRKSGSTPTDNGGFVGWSSGSHTISKCYSTGRVIYTNATDPTDKGFLGQYTSGTLTGNFWDTGTSLQATTAGTATGKTTLEMKTQSTFTDAGWDFLGEIVNGVNDYWNTSSGRNDGYPFLTWQTLSAPSGSGTIGDPYQIATLENLYWISASDVDVASPNQATRWAAYYIQTVDIDASSTSSWNGGSGWNTIGNFDDYYFTGSYNGGGHTISGLYINRNEHYQGMFGLTSRCLIKNLGLTNMNISRNLSVGSLAAQDEGGSIIDNCYSSGSVSGGGNVGGLVGTNISPISNCYSTVNINISGGSGGGGLVGGNWGIIENCYSAGNINGSGFGAGGLVGWNCSEIRNSYSTGNVDGFELVGGLVGYNESTISNCYCTGSVSGSDRVGGLLGGNWGIIENCYSTGSVSGSYMIAGFVADNVGPVDNCFWDTQTSGQSTSSGATGKTTAEMKTQSTFTDANWDINIWNMDAGINSGYPYLDWQNPTGTPLPVELSSFSATVIGSTIKLNWSTATEVNNYGFEVERCALSAERKAWEKIVFVNGNGNSNSTKSYSYEDKNVTAGKYSYRLKQIDTDGQFEYSKAIEVDMVGVKKFELSQNYPNPFNPTTTIQYSLLQTGIVKLTLYNILGQEIRTLVNEVKEAGAHTFNFNASDLNSGVYIYKLQAGTFTQTKKMTLVK